jgi:hypothetical protein
LTYVRKGAAGNQTDSKRFLTEKTTESSRSPSLEYKLHHFFLSQNEIIGKLKKTDPEINKTI